MGLPNLSIIFKNLAVSAAIRSSHGVVALIIKDTVPTVNPIVLTDDTTIPTTLTADNQEQIKLTFSGGVNVPTKVIVYILPVDAVNYSLAQTYLETVKWNYLAVPSILATETTAMGIWIKGLRDDKDLKVKAVLPNTPGDHEGIINYDTDGTVVGTKTYTAIQYCSRIAGILAGIPLSMSATYQVLTEVDDVPHNTITEFNTLIDAGDLVLMNDGEKVKIARAINSLTTLNDDKGEDFQKIKIVDIMDLIHDDIKTTYNDYYVGKVANDYNHKCILIAAINDYLVGLEDLTYLDKGKNSVSLDIVAQTKYLTDKGIDISAMKEIDIKNANTGSSVFLAGTVAPLDAMEDLALTLAL